MNAIIDARFSIRARSGRAAPAPNGSFSTWLAQQVLFHAFVPGVIYNPATLLYATLYTTAPDVSGGGVELGQSVDPTYQRQQIVFAAAPAPSLNVGNNAQIAWGMATVDWGFIVAAGLFDAPIGGNFFAYGLMLGPDGVTPTPRMVQQDDVFLIPANAFQVGLV